MSELTEIDEAVQLSGPSIDGLADALMDFSDSMTDARDDSE